jgi:hypothetical protein
MSALRVDEEPPELPPSGPAKVVHLELHTGQRQAASTFFAELLGWRTERIENRWGAYHALLVGGSLDAGIVECGTDQPRWLPYVEIVDIRAATDLARALGASVLLSPREGPVGWRSVAHTPVAGEIAFWQQKR